jgi:hypothetical protein
VGHYRCTRMDQSAPQALIERYTRGHQAVVDALAGVSAAELDHKSDGWSAREIAHHLAELHVSERGQRLVGPGSAGWCVRKGRCRYR